ncbi:trypsin-like peptidase domain-containing protein [Candidatus Poribacteria bacterium]|nr:trypsin-like peptidase domain-containing protein [Candidatus Poribacteria bacterium]
MRSTHHVLRLFQLLIFLGMVVLSIGISPAHADKSILQLMESEFQAIVKSVKPSVVEVIATYTVPIQSIRKMGDKLVVDDVTTIQHYQNIGSGIIIDSAGHVVTTGAVVEDADRIEVVFADGRRSRAKRLGVDPLTDIAVLAVEGDNHSPTKLGDSDQIGMGSWIVTVGSSYGHSPTLAFGIVSGLEILPNRPFYDAIKINAPVNPGNSGGAVVNTSGEIVGLIVATLAEPHFMPLPRVLDFNTASATQLKDFDTALPDSAVPALQKRRASSAKSKDLTPKASQNQRRYSEAPRVPSAPRAAARQEQIWMGNEISFAIPIRTVQKIAEQIIRYGKVPRGWLGVRLEQVEDSQNGANERTTTAGVRVVEVFENSPAQKAGILPQDSIVEFNNAPIRTFLELKKLVATSAPNTRVTLKIRRGKRILQRDVVLGEIQ